MKLNKSKKKESKKKIQELRRGEHEKQINKQPFVSLTEWVDLMKR